MDNKRKEQQAFDGLKDAFKNFTAAAFIFICIVCLGYSLFSREASNFLNSLMGTCLLVALLVTVLMGYSNKLETRGSKRSGTTIALIAGLIIIIAGIMFTMFAK